MASKTLKQNNKFKLNPYVLVILSFIAVIALGSFLLTMPWTQKDGQWANYMDALTTAVSATCVTGVATYPKGFADTISIGGQAVVIAMVQIGGLGFITILTFIVTIFKQKLQFQDRYYISQMVGSTNFADVVKFVRKIIIITGICEGAGFLLFIPAFGIMYNWNIGDTLWNSLFHSISSFNNAGFDLFSSVTSLIRDPNGTEQLSLLNPGMYVYFCTVCCVLIVAGGISFIVISDIFDFKKRPKQWRAFTKAVLLTSGTLIIVGTGLLFLTDGLKGTDRMTLLDCLFESISCRTAGFFTYPQYKMSSAGKIVSNFLMIVGGSPLSTAGGIKTTTVFILILAMVSYFRGKKAIAFKRSFSTNLMVKAMSLIFISLFVLILGYVGLKVFGLDPAYKYEDITFDGANMSSVVNLDELYVYEVFSCFGTVGYFVGFEPYLAVGGKIVLCLLMFLGRLGPITFFQVFHTDMDNVENIHYQYVEEDLLIG